MNPNRVVVAYRPGPEHRWYQHQDYGTSGGWSSFVTGPISSIWENGEWSRVTALRNEGYEVIVTELPHGDWPQ